MMKKLSIIMLLALCLWGVSGGVALADWAGLVNCGKETVAAPGKTLAQTQAESCNFATAIDMINILIKWLIMIAMPLAAIAFAYGGWLHLTAGGQSGIDKSKKIFMSVGIGLLVILSSWLVFKLIADTFLRTGPDGKTLYGTYLN